MTSKSWIRWPLIGLFILWLFFSIASYFVVYKPISPELSAALTAQPPLAFSAAALGRSLLDLLAALWIALLALGLGLPVWRWLGLEEQRSREDNSATLLFSWGLGFGILGLLVLALGLIGWLTTAVLFPLTIVLTPFAIWEIRRLEIGDWAISRFQSLISNKLIAIFLLLTLGMGLTLALLPPTDWDGLFYHLKGPQLYLSAGAIRLGTDLSHLNFPALFEMLYTLALALRGDVTAQLLHFFFSLLLAGLVALMARQLFGVKNGGTAVIFLFATPMILLLGTWAYNDLPLAFYSVAALYAFIRWQECGNTRWLTLGGLFAGLAMSMKYTSFITPLFIGLLLLWQYRRNLRQSWQPLLAFALPAALVAAPWYLKNWAFTGNPVYPFVFGGRFWDDFRAAAYSDTGSGIGFDIMAILRLPFDLTLGLRDASQDGPTGPLYLGFLPLLLLYSLRRRPQTPPALRTIALYALASYLFWAWGVINSAGLWQSRLLLPAFVALCPALAWLLQETEQWDHPQFSTRRFLNLALAFVLVLVLLGQFTAWLTINPLPYLSGGESREAYLARRLGPHYAAMQAINVLPADAVVTFLWEPRSYYCERDCRPDTILDKFDHLVYLHNDAASIARAWREEGITHVLLWRLGLDFVLQEQPDPPALSDLEANYLDLVGVVGDGYYELFVLRQP
ncbi:MAG: glycosyltransferase family 39 protein [Ardenticatenaceae bacterium]|nr:glycosyltransferase family 39 protein [Anaerolineales bacterium]MCB8921417.1 glycosyltransferase family 39 protein [Ardenticatenaceae bacterium]MCB8991534.1 glycosyltransferase family 39 protein [Ardenticatenaceae bacterium]MCB9005105.1 glycosyltransferase family 39 protein [Ardenticatenaceae bacterium]